MMPEELFVRSLYEAMRDYLFLSVVVSLIIMALIVLLSLRMTAFTHDFTEGLQKFGKGDLTVKLPPYRDADLNHISNTFNQMTERINFLVEDGYKKQLLIQQMDIEFLQSQMNPHFLFNTLFTISTRAKMSGDDLLFEMVQALTSCCRPVFIQKMILKSPSLRSWNTSTLICTSKRSAMEASWNTPSLQDRRKF